MKKIAFIDHSFHQKSLAFEFLKTILRKKYIVEEYWDYLSDDGVRVTENDLNNKGYYCLFFAQIFPTKSLVDKLECKNIVWMPMYDSEVNSGLLRVVKLLKSHVKILSFSKQQHDKYVQLGLNSTYLQFFPKPIPKPLNLKNRLTTVYYWPRHEVISWDIVKRLLGEKFNGKVILQNVPDPKNTFIMPSKEDIKKYNIQIIDRWLEKEDAINLRAKADIFIAPRLYEGIGMAFLEAMSCGCAVISPNTPTMNEYIEDNINGYLYDINNPREIDLKRLKKIKSNAYKYIVKGYGKWSRLSDKQIHDFIERSYITNINLIKYLYVYLILGFNKVSKLIKKSI